MKVKIIMNCKLEKFWNFIENGKMALNSIMNCKLEKFWNTSEKDNINIEETNEL